jgi:Fe2+ transport system protein FeoA
VGNKTIQEYTLQSGQCAGSAICPLNRIQVGMVVCIKQLTTSPETAHRLREMGFCEQQRIRLLSRHSNLICLVCDSRLGISEKLAEQILVEPVVTPFAEK